MPLITAITYQRVNVHFLEKCFLRGEHRAGLCVVLQTLSIKEMQNSIDFAAAEVPRLRFGALLTPFPEQNVTKYKDVYNMLLKRERL